MTKISEKNMNIISNDEFGYLVIDNFLEDSSRNRLHAHAIHDTFFYENAFEWNRVWHPLSGMSLLTGPKSFGNTGKPGPQYPTGTPYDEFFSAFEARLPIISSFLDIPQPEIKLVLSAYLYRAGWGIPWHEDAGEGAEYKGAFSYYLHKEWRGNWGGELMILADERLAEEKAGSIDLAFTQGTGLAAPSHIGGGIGTFLMPKPNRMVIMRPGVVHAVNPVSALAGEMMRFSLAGFYV